MNFKHIWIVFKKEMKDAFRDKKSVFSNIFLPLLLIPLMYYCMGIFMRSANKEVEENMRITIVTNEDMKTAEEFTKSNLVGEDKIEIVSMNKEEATKALNDGDITCIIDYSDKFFSNITNGVASGITLEYNSLKNSSTLGMQKLSAKIMMLNQKLAAEKLISLNVSPEILNLVSADVKDSSLDISSSGKSSSQMLMMIIPMYLAVVIVTAGVPIAVDVLAGERERNTFEPLLSTKANRLSILIGKYLAILVFSIIAIIMSFIGLILGIIMNPEIFSQTGEAITFTSLMASMNMPLGALLLALLSAIVLAVVFAGVQIAISTWSKTVKEAQTYLSYMMFPVMILGFATMFMGAGDIEGYMAYIPIFNTIASLKMVLGGVINYTFLTVGVIVNIIFVILITAFVIKLFNNEKIVIR